MLYDKKWDKEVKIEPWRKCCLDAARILETKGWVQHRFCDYGGYCILGALRQADGWPDHWSATVVDAAEHVLEAIGETVNIYADIRVNLSGVSYWNDNRVRTKEEVLAALRKAAEA